MPPGLLGLARLKVCVSFSLFLFVSAELPNLYQKALIHSSVVGDVGFNMRFGLSTLLFATEESLCSHYCALIHVYDQRFWVNRRCAVKRGQLTLGWQPMLPAMVSLANVVLIWIERSPPSWLLLQRV